MKSFFDVLFIIGVAVFLFCFIQWCFALANVIRSKYVLEETETLLRWNLDMAILTLYLNIINILAKYFV
jgi:hypothetical protein|nr:MAG TPA: hypothetical protein [Caudoviricetes sp.]